jgi:nucleotide-binding universal stress UspA family protein
MASKWKVLAPINLRFDSEVPVEYAAGFADALGAELVLLHVITNTLYGHPRGLGWPPSAWGERTPDVDIHRLVIPGPIPESIVRYADHIEADMLLMTTRTYGRRGRFWRRSITAEVMDSTQRPVCVTRMPDADSNVPFRCHSILCVVGLEDQDAALIQQAQEIATRSDARLVLLHIVPEISEGLLAYGVDRAQARPLSAKLAREKLVELAAGISLPITTSVMVGSPAKCIGLAAREHAADIVIASRVAPRARFECSGAYTMDLGAALSRLGCPLLTVPLGRRLEAQRPEPGRGKQPLLRRERPVRLTGGVR